MKPTIGALIIALLFGTLLQAQSLAGLAEIARRERARRAAEPGDGRLYTNEDLRTATGSVSPATGETPAPAPPGEAEGEPEAAASEAGPEAAADSNAQALIAWQAEVEAQQELVESLQDQEVQQQLDINRWRAEFTAPITTQEARNQAQVELGLAETRLTAIRAQLEEAVLELVRLQESGPVQP